MRCGGDQLSSTPRPAKSTKTLELSFSAFFNYSVLQYTIPLTSKRISFGVTLVNLLSSHTFDSHWIPLQQRNCDSTLLHTVYSLLVFSSHCSLHSLFSLISILFQVNSNENAYMIATDPYWQACQLANPGRSNIFCQNAKPNNFTRLSF